MKGYPAKLFDAPRFDVVVRRLSQRGGLPARRCFLNTSQFVHGAKCGVAGGLTAMRRGLFYGVWLGGVFGLFRNHVASLREQAKLSEEDERLAQVGIICLLYTSPSPRD